MANELKTICDLLEGYKPNESFEVLSAIKGDNNVWQLVIRKITNLEEKENQEGASNDNK